MHHPLPGSAATISDVLARLDTADLVDSMPDPVYVIDLQGRFIYVNQAGLRLAGYTPEEILGRHFIDVIAPEHRALVIERFKGRLQGAESAPYAAMVLRKDGTRCWVEIHSAPLLENGKIVAVRGIARDITARMDMESALLRRNVRLAGLLEVSRGLTSPFDRERILTATVPMIRRLAGASSACVVEVPVTAAPLAMIACDGMADSVRERSGPERFLDGDSNPLQRVVRERRAVLVPDVAKPSGPGAGFLRLMESVNARGAVTLPLILGDRVQGALVLFCQESTTPDADDMAFLETAAGLLAAALANSSLFEDIRHASERLEHSLAEEERQRGIFQATHQAMNDGILLEDPDHRILVWNRRNEEIYGIPTSEVAGKTTQEMAPSFLRGIQDVAALDAWVRGIRERDGSGELVITLVTDRTLHLRIYTAPVSASNGRRIGRVWSTTDLTSQVDAEARYRELYDRAPDLYQSADPAGVIIDCNETGLRMLGYTREEYVGHRVEEFMPPEYHDRVQIWRRDLVEGRVGLQSADVQYVRKDGSTIDLHGVAVAVRDAEGRITSTRVVLRDITEKKQLERKLAEQMAHLEETVARRTAELVQSEKMATLGQLVANTAHAINNPLTYLLSNSKRMAEDLDKLPKEIIDALTAPSGKRPGSAEHLARTVRNLQQLVTTNEAGMERIAEFIERLRNLIRPGEGPTEEIDVNEVVRDTLAFYRLQVRPSVTVAEDLTPVPPVRGNRSDLGEVLMNLLINADQAIPEVGTIRVATRHHGNQVALEVEDSGVGMEPETMIRAFDPFFSTKGRGGTGLGLTITRRIVESMGGQIRAESDAGRGSTFTLALPALPGRSGAPVASRTPKPDHGRAGRERRTGGTPRRAAVRRKARRAGRRRRR